MDNDGQIHSWMNRAVNMIGASRGKGTDAHCWPAHLQALESRRASRGLCRLLRIPVPLTIVKNVEGRLILDYL